MFLETCCDGFVAGIHAIEQVSWSFEGVDRLGCRYEEDKEKYV